MQLFKKNMTPKLFAKYDKSNIQQEYVWHLNTQAKGRTGKTRQIWGIW